MEEKKRRAELSEVKGQLESLMIGATIVERTQPALEAKLMSIKDSLRRATSPQRFSVPIMVNPNQRVASFSKDTDEQAKFSEHGYIWQDYYRPMTYQSVLNSLLETHQNSTKQKVFRWLESAGVVAGSLVGITSFSSGLGSRAYSDAVAISTAVFLPEARKLLLEDVQKYVKNLGSLSMDTIVEVPPNGVVDKYIFFPRGPIFGYGIDEFNITAPSFIVQVDNSDVQVDGILVDKDQAFASGIRPSAELTRDALDSGLKPTSQYVKVKALRKSASGAYTIVIQALAKPSKTVYVTLIFNDKFWKTDNASTGLGLVSDSIPDTEWTAAKKIDLSPVEPLPAQMPSVATIRLLTVSEDPRFNALELHPEISE
jgi:hypothetical protein